MALLLGTRIIQGIQPGPQLVREHPDIFWGLIASIQCYRTRYVGING
jgi:putative tricarboxylic transport membrane protein